MTTIQLAKKALEHVTDTCFDAMVSADEGGKCSDGWCDSVDFYLSREELLYLIQKEYGYSEIFEGLELKKVDVESVLSDLAMEAAWPDGGPCASVKDVIPDELQELSDELDSMDDTDEEEVESVREKLMQVEDGEYTFRFTIEADGYYFAENAEEYIDLTAEEALGLLYGKHDLETVFQGICDKAYGEEFINDKAEELGFADDYNEFSHSGECPELESYLDAWRVILDSILSGMIDEDKLDSYLGYFDDNDNPQEDFSDWIDQFEEDEEE